MLVLHSDDLQCYNPTTGGAVPPNNLVFYEPYDRRRGCKSLPNHSAVLNELPSPLTDWGLPHLEGP